MWLRWRKPIFTRQSEMQPEFAAPSFRPVTERAMHRNLASDESNEWFAFRVRPRHEKQVSIALRQKGFAEFLPLYKSRRQWADRIQVVEMPLFPGYIFCSTVRSSIVPVLMTRGVIDVVRPGPKPLPADKAEIEALQQTVSVDGPLEAWRYTEVGETGSFSILRGPLAGLTGILV